MAFLSTSNDTYSSSLNNFTFTVVPSSHFTFELDRDSKIFKISSMRDINKLRELITCEYTLYDYEEYYYDFEKLQEMDYDGIELELNSY